MTQDHITQHLNAIAENSVSAYPALVPKNLADQELRLPSLVEQRRIGEMFSTIDQKIALNRALNHNLRARREQRRSLFSLCRANAVNGDVSCNLEAILDHSSEGGEVHLAA